MDLVAENVSQPSIKDAPFLALEFDFEQCFNDCLRILSGRPVTLVERPVLADLCPTRSTIVTRAVCAAIPLARIRL
jgi:hypothetical protein